MLTTTPAIITASAAPSEPVDALHLRADAQPSERHADPEQDPAAEHDQRSGAVPHPPVPERPPSSKGQAAGLALEELAEAVERAAEREQPR